MVFAMVYQKVNTESLLLKNYMHSSGTMDTATLFKLESEQHRWMEPRSGYARLYGTLFRPHGKHLLCRAERDDLHSPVAMVYGTGYYAENPIVYSSKLKERTEAKNYTREASAMMRVSIVHQIEYASAFVKDASACLENIQYGFSSTSMKIEEEVTEGSVHVGELIAGDEDHGWKKPLVEIDENYAGTFKISKKMGVSTCCPEDGPGEDWLSCCTGGYGHMDDDDKLWGERRSSAAPVGIAWGDSWTYKLKEQPL